MILLRCQAAAIVHRLEYPYLRDSSHRSTWWARSRHRRLQMQDHFDTRWMGTNDSVLATGSAQCHSIGQFHRQPVCNSLPLPKERVCPHSYQRPLTLLPSSRSPGEPCLDSRMAPCGRVSRIRIATLPGALRSGVIFFSLYLYSIVPAFKLSYWY